MIRIIECPNPADAPALLGRGGNDSQMVDDSVAKILADVKKRGDEAIREYSLRFDGVAPTAFELPFESMLDARVQTDAAFLEVLETAAENIALYHSKQTRGGYTLGPRPGVFMGQRVTPLERVGVYVPGGTARYPSSVLMNVIPAKLAGVKEVIIFTPPNKDGSVPPDILAAASVAGADRVFLLGGAQAVAAMSYGTDSVPKVDKIVGPGNIYVATAKRMVYGLVDIDMIAGPSEVLIVADGSAVPAFVAADLLSQAEHDPLSAAILATPLRDLAQKVREELEKQIEDLPRKETARRSIEQNSAIFLTSSIDDAITLSNTLAPEHLELCIEEPFALLSSVKNAGSVFLGHYTPEALGDYLAGPNHILPTGGTARFSSPLSVDDFVKKSSFLYYDKNAMAAVAEQVALFARREGLDAHARSAGMRAQEEDV